jgi:GNAT superfamily N-acetyltransferase
MELNQNVLNDFVQHLKKTKYPNKIQDLKLSYCTDEDKPFIWLILIQIKKSCRGMGYGSVILSDIVRFADEHNVQVRLYATDIYGCELKRLYGYYRKHGFVLIKKYNDDRFIYKPKNKLKKM